MSQVAPDGAPSDATFNHAPSGRRYQIPERDAKLWYRELLLTSCPDEVVLSECPVA